MGTQTPLSWKQLFDREDFHREFYYDGPLGVEYTPQAATFRLWAPTAEAVELHLFRTGHGGLRAAAVAMQRQARGVWACTVSGDKAGMYYTYQITVDGSVRETVDPYARAVGINGLRGMVLPEATATPAGWEKDVRPEIPASRRVIWEVNVRDFSSDPASGIRMSWRGKYLGLTQDGTTLNWDGVHPTGLAHLKRLGITYVQIMPMYDFGSVDESRISSGKYNWGYDPANFNVPEGSYSSDPGRGEVRVRELRQMIAGLHAAGIGVIMDVVYNHMYKWTNPLNNTVPYYFFRQNADGSPSNGSGCGNEVASERPMARRYILDSLRYWAEEYHLDGFRFDLMGLIDVDTINAARAMLDSLPGGERILMYGEPWQGGASALRQPGCTKEHIGLLSPRVGVFSDGTRDAIKGGCFEARAPGYVSGRWESQWDVGASVAAWCRSQGFRPRCPGQIISYVSAHDNYTLWDKLKLVKEASPDFDARDEEIVARNRLAAGIYLTCLGTPFLQAGEEFARTKWGEHNSYKSPIAVNRLEWSRVARYHDLVDFYRGLIGLRGAFPRLSAADQATADAMQFFSLELPLVGWTLPAAPGDDALWQALAVYYNPLDCEKQVTLPAGGWQLLCDGVSADLWRRGAPPAGGVVTLKPLSATVFGKPW